MKSTSLALHLPHYDRSWLRQDMIAGVTSWALVVPQAVAYAQIAGLPSQAGLSAAFAGPLGYALLGTTNQLMVTPTSSAAAISASLVTPLAAGDANRFLILSAALAILSGAIFFIMGWLKLGFVSQFLALSVQVGFMFGLGMVITVGQVPKVLGISAPEGNFFQSLWYVLTHLGETNIWSLILGVAALAALLYGKRYRPTFPAALLVVSVGIAITALFSLADQGVAIVGYIPPGLPMPSISLIKFTDIVALLPPALLLAIMGYAETASVSQDLATRHHYEIKPDRDLKALGLANALSGLFQGFLVAGGASQTAANDRAGAKSQLSSLVVSGLTLITALALTPLFYYLPQAVLGAIVIHAVMGFFRLSELERFYGLRRDSFWLAMFALMATLFLGVLPGLVLAVTLSIILILISISRADASLLGKAPSGDVYGDLAVNSDFTNIPGMLIFRLNAPLIAINARRLHQLVRDAVNASDPPPQVVLLDLGMNSDLDIQSVDILREMRHELEISGIAFWIANVHSKVDAMLVRSGYAPDQAARNIYRTIPLAVEEFRQQLLTAQGDETDPVVVEDTAAPVTADPQTDSDL